MKIEQKFTFIDLFCGIGGFHEAMSQMGGKCVFASDIDKECQNTYFQNYGLLPEGDITKVDEKNIPVHDVLCAGFPCQSFSKAGNRMGVNDPRGTLFFDIMRIAKYHKPKFMLLENVRNLASHDNGNTWKVIYNNIIEAGYKTFENPIIFSPHYIGIPQHRERVFILCVRNDIGDLPQFNFNKKEIKTCDIDSILLNDNEIEDIKSFEIEKPKIEIIELWNEFIKNIKQPLPGFPVWVHRLKDLDPLEDLSKKAKWEQNFILKNNQLYILNKSFLDKWLKKANSNPSFIGAKAKFEWQAGKTQKPDLWNTIMQFRPSGLRVKQPTHFPALVAITQTSILGSKKRYLTPRECARLQGFPDTFKLNSKNHIAYKQLGNSVNVKVVKLFAELLIIIN